MAEQSNVSESGANCLIAAGLDLSGTQVIEFTPDKPLADYLKAMKVAEDQAWHVIEEFMLISWYDRDCDFESPQHASECHLDSAIPGYVDYGISHGAKLMVDIEQGRFVFFYMPLDLQSCF